MNTADLDDEILMLTGDALEQPRSSQSSAQEKKASKSNLKRRYCQRSQLAPSELYENGYIII